MNEVFSQKPKQGEAWDIIIIGSGPSGLTSAIYATRGALSTLIIGGSSWGGQLMLTTTVDNFPGFPQGIEGPELLENMKKQAVRFGAEFRAADVSKVDFFKKPFEVYIKEGKFLAKSVIIATGATTKWLDAPGTAQLIGRGVSSCAPCDAPFFKDKKVAVVGGGDSAMEEALVLTKYASEVTIIHRRDEFRASKAMQEKVLSQGKVKVLLDSEVVKAEGTDKLTGITIKNNKTGKETSLDIDGLFIAIGHTPETSIFQGQLELDERGYVKRVGPGSQTSVTGVFVAGDVHDSVYKQAITAAGFGCMAAMDTIKYLESEK